MEVRPRPIESLNHFDLATSDLRRLPMLMGSIGRDASIRRPAAGRGWQVVRAAGGVARAPAGSAARLYLLGSIHEKSGETGTERSVRDTRGVPKRGEALLQGLIVCGKCGLRMASRYHSSKRPSYYCGEHARSPMNEYCGHISAATLDDLVAREGPPCAGARRARPQPPGHR